MDSLHFCPIDGLPLVYNEHGTGKCYDPKCSYSVKTSYDSEKGTFNITMTHETYTKIGIEENGSGIISIFTNKNTCL
jgi:hypothetical protein